MIQDSNPSLKVHLLPARVSREGELPEVGVPLGQVRQSPRNAVADEVEGEVELAQALAAGQALHHLNGVHRQVDVLKALEPVQVLQPGDGVVLEVDDAQSPAQLVQVLYARDVQLVQRDLVV